MASLEARLESGVPSVGRPSKDPHDPAYQRVAFVQWPDKTTDAEKIEAMERFMRANFPKTNVVYKDHFNDKASFVHIGTPQAARKVFDNLKGKTVEGYPNVKAKAALTSIDLSRNFSLNRAEELVKKDENLRSRSVEVKRAKDRGIYVDGLPAFVQRERYSRKGEFEGEFRHLKLPP